MKIEFGYRPTPWVSIVNNEGEEYFLQGDAADAFLDAIDGIDCEDDDELDMYAMIHGYY